MWQLIVLSQCSIWSCAFATWPRRYPSGQMVSAHALSHIIYCLQLNVTTSTSITTYTCHIAIQLFLLAGSEVKLELIKCLPVMWRWSIERWVGSQLLNVTYSDIWLTYGAKSIWTKDVGIFFFSMSQLALTQSSAKFKTSWLHTFH